MPAAAGGASISRARMRSTTCRNAGSSRSRQALLLPMLSTFEKCQAQTAAAYICVQCSTSNAVVDLSIVEGSCAGWCLAACFPATVQPCCLLPERDLPAVLHCLSAEASGLCVLSPPILGTSTAGAMLPERCVCLGCLSRCVDQGVVPRMLHFMAWVVGLPIRPDQPCLLLAAAVMAQQELRGKDPKETLTWNTPEGIPVKPIYTRDDVSVRYLLPWVFSVAMPQTRCCCPAVGGERGPSVCFVSLHTRPLRDHVHGSTMDNSPGTIVVV